MFNKGLKSNTLKHVDIIISGGGMVGTTLAACLGRNPLLKNRKVVLLEANSKSKWQFKPNHYSNRVSSINQNTVNLMKYIGAWKHMLDCRVKSVSSMKVWDSAGALVHFKETLPGCPLSYIVENDVLLAAVNKELETISNVTVLHESKIKSYKLPSENDSFVQITLDDGTDYSCNLLIGADGANSQVRKEMGTQYLGWNYDQAGIVATLYLNKNLKNDTAWQRFISTGPVAILPLTDEMSSLVWSTTKEKAKQLVALTNDEFVNALNSALKEEHVNPMTIDSIRKCTDAVISKILLSKDKTPPSPPLVTNVENGSRVAFPFSFGHSVSYVKPSVALVGDAAHKIHPLAGQGVNLGFGDIACLLEKLTISIQNGFPLGHITALREYESERQTHNVATMLTVDCMAKVYTSNNPLLLTLGNIAIHMVNYVPYLKEVMINQASK
uniref:Ubiquinone biosynthesis monooxygenase COQ6, mitochondrial n=2 Tax=Clastoptera arizonana TaxID=38151 RepID=A0A1B6D947_9HEMI